MAKKFYKLNTKQDSKFYINIDKIVYVYPYEEISVTYEGGKTRDEIIELIKSEFSFQINVGGTFSGAGFESFAKRRMNELSKITKTNYLQIKVEGSSVINDELFKLDKEGYDLIAGLGYPEDFI